MKNLPSISVQEDWDDEEAEAAAEHTAEADELDGVETEEGEDTGYDDYMLCTTGDSSACTSWGDDCCASMDWGEE